MTDPRVAHGRDQPALHVTHSLQELEHGRGRERHSVVWPRSELHVRHGSSLARLPKRENKRKRRKRVVMNMNEFKHVHKQNTGRVDSGRLP